MTIHNLGSGSYNDPNLYSHFNFATDSIPDDQLQTKCYIMEKMDGNLDDLHLNDSIPIINIIKAITTQLKCLYQNGYGYTDLKPDNLLYKCIDKNKFKIYISDLGSLVSRTSGYLGCAAYPAPESPTIYFFPALFAIRQ